MSRHQNLNPAMRPIHQELARAIAAARGLIGPAIQHRIAQLPPGPRRPGPPNPVRPAPALAGAALDVRVAELHARGHDDDLAAFQLGVTPQGIRESRRRQKLPANGTQSRDCMPGQQRRKRSQHAHQEAAA